MTKTTKARRLREAQESIDNTLAKAEEKIKEYMENAQKDFCTFFHWNAKDMYYTQSIKEYFTEMPRISDLDDIETVKADLYRRIERIEFDLLNRSSFGSCTDEIVNLEHRMQLESKRIIRKKLLELTYIF